MYTVENDACSEVLGGSGRALASLALESGVNVEWMQNLAGSAPRESMSDIAIYRKLTKAAQPPPHWRGHLSSDKYVGVDLVTYQLKVASRFSPCECFDCPTLIKCAVVCNLNECATGRGVHKDVCTGETV